MTAHRSFGFSDECPSCVSARDDRRRLRSRPQVVQATVQLHTWRTSFRATAGRPYRPRVL